MIRINDSKSKTTLRGAALLGVFLLLAAVAGFGQQAINLAAGPTTTTLPDGTVVPMWGYTCGAPVANSTATCAALNPASVTTTSTTTTYTWSPVVITVPSGQGLTINLTNNLSFTPTGATTANTVPTSIVIVGQVGGGLGTAPVLNGPAGAPTSTQSPSHTDAQGCVTWFIAGSNVPPGTPCTTSTPLASPPMQGPRVQSMATEVAAGSTTALKWGGLKPGTYLLESGTHPSIQVPMGLIGVLVVTSAPTSSAAGTAYPAVGTAPAVTYNAELPLEFSEIDPVQNRAVSTAVNTAGFSETRVWDGHVGMCGNPTSPVGVVNTCYPPAVNYTPFYYLINGVAFNKTYPSASVFPATAGVTTSSTSTCTVSTTTPTCPVTSGITGTVLVRLVNAGLRMHVPSIVNSLTQGFNGAGAAATVSGFALIAEDGNVIPNVAPPGATTAPAAPKVQTDVFMAAGKTYDVLINVPATPSGASAPPSLPIYDRELSLSGNSSERDAGMLAYISVNNATLPVSAGTGVFSAAQANPDTYNSLVAGQPFSISDPSKGVIANDINVYGVALLTPPANGAIGCSVIPQSAPVPGMCANGTFTYTPNSGSTATSDFFTYCANGTVTGTTCSSGITATVTLGASSLSGGPTANNITYTSKMATFLKIPSPGVLAVDSDPNGLPLQVALSSVTPPTGVTIDMDQQGGFTASVGSGATTSACPSGTPAVDTCYSFSYVAQNSQGRQSSPATVTLIFQPASNLQVNVLDAQAYNNCNGNNTCIAGLAQITDYRWIIEEDKTFWIDPNCTANDSTITPGNGCPTIVGPAGQSTIPTFGVNFHTSTMDFVAQGCTGQLSCEGGQTMLDTRPACTSPGVPAGCSTTAGQHIAAVCDVGNGACRPDTTGNGSTWVLPGQVHLDPAKRYYISVLPGDAANPFPSYTGAPGCSTTTGALPAPDSNGIIECGHTMSGAPVPPACNVLGGPNACTGAQTFAAVNVLVLPTPLPTGKLSVLVFEDDFPLNGEQDGGGGVDTLSPLEPGLGGFNLVLWDNYGNLGDATGQDSFDMFNQPLSNALVGTIDPVTGNDACPVSAQATANPAQAGITGMIVTCPKYESDNKTLSPLAGQAVIANLMPDKFSVQAYPGADRIARGEEWIQTNTLDGQHPHDAFIPIGGPGYFQEYGPAGYHVMIGFANPAIINARHADVCNGMGSPGAVGPCTNTIDGQVNVERLSRIPDERLYASESHDALSWTQCWVSLGDPDGEDFMFTKCDANGNFKFSNVPGGNWRLTIGDQWNDQIIDGLSTPANVGCTPNGAITPFPTNPPTPPVPCPGGQTLHMGSIGVQQWQANLYTTTFIDDNKNGIKDPGEIGIPLIYTMIHYRDGHNANALTTDFDGVANFNETFPLFNWYVVEADSTRYKTTGTHTVYDAGGPADGSTACTKAGVRGCGTSIAYNFMTNTFEAVPLPADLSVPGAVYCAKADCSAEAAGFAAGTAKRSFSTASTGRLDPPWVWAEGWAGITGLSNWMEIGKAPYAACNPNLTVSATNFCATVTTTAPGSTTPTKTLVGENGGIYGNVTYASTRPFDDASQMIQQPWEPNVPNVTVNLYQEGFAADGVTPTLTMVDTTQTSSWDAWAQGFYPNYTDPTTGTPLSYMSCPGQGQANSGPNADLFYFTLYDQPNYLDWYNSVHSTPQAAPHALPYNSQFKCYDAMKISNQFQPAPYDGKYFFPSSLGINPATGKLVSTVGSTNGVTASMAGTNCTICVANPDSTDNYRVGTPMLPPGKYTVEVIMPPGYEVYKEEDKNLLIGDNMIAPVTQQFAGLGGDIFIIPDQASVASMYDQSGSGYNGTNYQNSTTGSGLADELSGVPGFPGYTDPVWPCVGEMRVVPDYLSEFPQAKEVAPFAGATRPLCDRKEVTLQNQMAVNARFFIFTSTHIAAKYTGVITDDFTSEFDPFSPQFGEKFSPPNMPISTRDYLGNELNRVYADHWGIYDGLTFSSWDVNPPNITGYSPSMMTQCMNDPGPIPDPNHPGQLIQDPLYNPAYSDFCYVNPYMPGVTTYNDTPVIPTQAFVGAGYNNVDCSYPDTTPAIKEVDSSDGIGPWVSAAGPGHTLTITALGDTQVNNHAYSGPSANTAPFNLKTINRHYGFGTQCTSATATGCSAVSSVTIGGVVAPVTGWSDTQITVQVPTGVPDCTIQQQVQYGGLSAQCGQLVITAGNGKQSIDTVTVTVGGKTPTHVSANQSVQAAIDAASPGDLIIVDPTCTTTSSATTGSACEGTGVGTITTKTTAAHTEMLIMWKPVRLQGVGAVSSIIDANAFPAGKLLNPWRRHINCLFGLNLQGVPWTASGGSAPYDQTGTYSCPDAGWNYFTAQPDVPQIDRLPLEATVGWDATLNGNLAEQLQEPSLMGAFEGAGITVLAKGLDFHGQVPWNDGTEAGAFPTVTTLLTGVVTHPENAPGTLGALSVGDNNSLCTDGTNRSNRFPSNFICNPSSIDGLTIRDSSQGGGGIFAHGWAHFLQVANNRVYNNSGTLTGGISIGQGEFATPYVQGGAANAAPGSCSDGTGFVTNQHLPYCLQLQTSVHNNYITNNSSLGDELFSATLAGGGGTTFCTGNDYYKFNYNWVCGNLSSGEGGGLVHLGEIQNGDIEHNTIAFNQATNPTIPTNGGGIQIMGTPDTDPVCGGIPDTDCPPGLSDGVGHNLVVNANLIQGNGADSGAGGGIRLQQVNGTEVSTFPKLPLLWNNVSITNNIIVNNVAGWDGAGISLQDALNVSIVNNTIVHNDSLASSGVLTQSIGTPLASAPPGNCTTTGPTGANTASCPQSAGITSTPNSSLLTTTFVGPAATITCPFGKTGCAGFSNPRILGDLVWQNRSFRIGITGPGSATKNLDQQNQVALFNMNGVLVPPQTSTGACNSNDTFWDIGVRGGGFTLTTTSTLTTTNAASSNPRFISSYCNGSRLPVECSVANGCAGPSGYGTPPGIVDAAAPNPLFTLTPTATVDEGNNWINVSWGPLSLSNDAIAGPDGNYGGGLPLGNYGLDANSGAIDRIAAPGGALPAGVPSTDFYGNPRPNPDGDASFDYGAVESQATSTTVTVTLSSISPNSGYRGTVVPVTLTGTNLTGANAITVSGTGVTVSDIAVVSSTTVTATFTISATAPINARNVSVTTPAGTSNNVTFTVLGPSITSISPTSGVRGGAAIPVTITGAGLTGATGVNVAGTGITVSNFAVVNATTVTATFTIAANATAGNRNVTVSTPNANGGVTNAVVFTVQGPTLSSISPTSGSRGTTVPVTLTGTNLSGASSITITPADFTCTITGTPTATTVTANCAIPNSAATGTHTVAVVTQTNGTTVTVNFSVHSGTVAFSGPTPAMNGGGTTTKNATITVRNTASGGTAGPVTLTTNPTLGTQGGSGNGTFSIQPGGTCVSGFVINAGSSCTVLVRYAGQTNTSGATDTLTITDTGAGTASQTTPSFTAN